MTNENQETPFEQVMVELADETQPFSLRHLRAFSDMDSASLRILEQYWTNISDNRKITLLEDLEELMEADTLVCCDGLAEFAMHDTHPGVRAQAIQLLWECEHPHLINSFMAILEEDPAEEVRAAAAAALGKFVLLGELEEISREKTDPVVAKLLDVIQRQPAGQIQRKALESLGYSSDASVPQLIKQAMQQEDTRWIASALFAMGRSLDNRWDATVLEHIKHNDLEVQIEAVRAAGDLEIAAAVDVLVELLEEGDLDIELLYQIYWALSKIGGKGVRELLERELQEAIDEDQMDVLDMALENLEFTEDSEDFDLFDIE
ncbi:MAG TPA: hypothetical protein DCK95_08415 [Anaerolineaceae bacterium]|nr:hypothetical protein [Anaerolineaceae bacterium]